MTGLIGNFMKKYYLFILTFIFVCCNSNVKKNHSDFKNSLDGIGIKFSQTSDSYVLINNIIKNSSADKAKGNKTLKEGDIVIAVKKNNDVFVSTKDKSNDELIKIFKGDIGDIIHIQLIRKVNNKITKEWIISLPVTHIIFTGNDLKEMQYDFMFNNDNSEYTEKQAKEYGDKYFNIYLKERPSRIANHAVGFAFMNWSNTGSYEKVREALPLIINDDIWCNIDGFILSSYYRTNDKKIISEGAELLENLLKKTTSPKTQTVLLYTLGDYYFDINDKSKASAYFNKILKINDNIWYENSSKKYLNDIKNLNTGQVAPNFCIKDINNNEICLDKLKGKYVIMYYWSPNCGFSAYEYKYLKDAYRKYQKYDNFFMLGVSVDHDEEKVLREIKKENIVWSQVLQNFDIKNELINQYSIRGIPSMFLIDTDGKILYRNLRGEDLILKLDDLLMKK